jgi:hypothetical protein
MGRAGPAAAGQDAIRGTIGQSPLPGTRLLLRTGLRVSEYTCLRAGYGHAPHLGQHVIGGIEVRQPPELGHDRALIDLAGR